MKKLALIALLSIPSFNIYSFANNQTLPTMSEADLRALEDELSRMTPEEQQAFYQITNEIKQIEEAVQKMSPEEQKIFQETMEKLSQLPESELERMISGQMSEEEMDALFTNLFADQQSDQTPSEPDKVEVKEVIPTTPENEGKFKEIIALIDAIITKSESFLLKMSSLPDTSGKILSWSQKNLLGEWNTSSWNVIRTEIELFIQKLKKAKELSEDKKTYVYLQAILDNESLTNSLKMIKDALDTCENCLEISPFGLEKIPASSKKLIQKILIRFGQVIKKGNIIKDFETLFSEQVSTEKKSKPSENQSTPKAPAPMKVVGDDSAYLSPYNDFSEYSYPSYDYNAPYTSPTTRYDAASTKPVSVASPRAIDAETKKPIGKDLSTQESKKATPASSGSQPKAESDSTPHEKIYSDNRRSNQRSDSIANPALNQQIVTFDKNLKDTATAIEKSTVLISLTKHLTSNETVDFATANDYLPEAVRKIVSALDIINTDISIIAAPLSPETKRSYKKKLSDTFAKYEKSLNPILNEWKELEDKWQKIENTISSDKLYAYIGDDGKKVLDEKNVSTPPKTKRNASKAIIEKIENPSSYATLYETIKEIKEKIEKI